MFGTDSKGAVLPVDTEIYSLQAILRSCYWFTDRCFLFIEKESAGRYLVHFAGRSRDADLPRIVGEFANSLLENQLRVDIEAETRTIRELIVAKAFAEGNLLADPVPGGFDDPVAGRAQEASVRAEG